MNKKFLSLLFIFMLIFSFSAVAKDDLSNPFFFFGFDLFHGSYSDSTGANVDQETSTKEETQIEFQPVETSVEFEPTETSVNFEPTETSINFQPTETSVNFEPTETSINFQPTENNIITTSDQASEHSSSDISSTADLNDNIIIPDPIGIDLPATWNDLDDVTLWRNAPDNTVVYQNIKNECSDPDSERSFNVMSLNTHYDLAFSGNNLVIKNLEKDYTGSGKVLVSCNGISESFTLSIIGPNNGDQPATWKNLHDVSISQKTPDYTNIYDNLALQCDDPDDAEVITLSWNGDFTLFFSNSDLIIKDLDNDEEGSFRIKLDCNGIKTSFMLNVLDKDDCSSTSASEVSALKVSNIYIPDAEGISAGNTLAIRLTFENEGSDKMEDIKADAIIAELGIRDAVGPFDLGRGDKESKTLFLEIPEWTAPGTYYARISVDDRVKYREIKIE